MLVRNNYNVATRAHTVVLIAAVGEVHPHNVEASIAKLVDGLYGVCLGADRADDGSPTEVALGLERSVELGEPVDSASELEVVEGGSRHPGGSTRRFYFVVLLWVGSRGCQVQTRGRC